VDETVVFGKTTDLPHTTDKLYHIRLCIEYILPCTKKRQSPNTCKIVLLRQMNNVAFLRLNVNQFKDNDGLFF